MSSDHSSSSSDDLKGKKLSYERQRREQISDKFRELSQLLLEYGFPKSEVSSQADTLNSAIKCVSKFLESGGCLQDRPNKRARPVSHDHRSLSQSGPASTRPLKIQRLVDASGAELPSQPRPMSFDYAHGPAPGPFAHRPPFPHEQKYVPNSEPFDPAATVWPSERPFRNGISPFPAPSDRPTPYQSATPAASSPFDGTATESAEDTESRLQQLHFAPGSAPEASGNFYGSYSHFPSTASFSTSSSSSDLPQYTVMAAEPHMPYKNDSWGPDYSFNVRNSFTASHPARLQSSDTFDSFSSSGSQSSYPQPYAHRPQL